MFKIYIPDPVVLKSLLILSKGDSYMGELNNRHLNLMGVLGKSIGNKEGGKKRLPKKKHLYSSLRRSIVP
ncbi:hypothetical protein ES703_74612 [subsurface metagenome]